MIRSAPEREAKRRQIERAKDDVSKCPAKSIVGHGTVVVNATPFVAAPITGTATIYNAVNDLGIGEPKGTRNLILHVKTSIGVTADAAFRIINGAGGRVLLRARFKRPSKPGVSAG